MLRINLDLIFRIRGIDQGRHYLKNLGFSSSYCTRLLAKKIVRLDLPIVEKLCDNLQCTPNDLCEWIPENNTSANHALNALHQKRREKAERWLYSLSVEEIENIAEQQNVGGV